MLYELDPSTKTQLPERAGDPYLDAVGRANDAVLLAKSGRSETAQREAILRLADTIANTPGGVEQLRQIQDDDQPETEETTDPDKNATETVGPVVLIDNVGAFANWNDDMRGRERG